MNIYLKTKPKRGRNFAVNKTYLRKAKLFNLGIYFLIFVASISLGYYALVEPSLALLTTSVVPIIGCILLVTCILPIGGIRLGDGENSISLFKLFYNIALAQAFWLLLGMGFFFAFMTYVPARFYAIMTVESTMEVIANFYDNQFGFFPWAIFGFWGLALAYTVYVKKRPPFVASTLNIIFGKFFTLFSKLYCELVHSWAVAGCVGSILAAGLILIFNFVRQSLGLYDLYLIPYTALAILFFSSPIIYFTLRPKYLAKRLADNTLSKLLFYILGSVLVIMLVSCFLSEILSNKLNTILLMSGFSKSEIPVCSSMLEFILKEGRIESAFWGWCFLWLPLAGSFIAKISHGRTVREVILALFLLPFILERFYNSNPDFRFFAFVEHLSSFQQSLLLLVLGFFCLGLGLWLIKDRVNNSFLHLGFMPRPSKLQRGRDSLLKSPKFLGISKFAPQVVLAPFVVAELHLLGGWVVVVLHYIVVGVFLVPLLYLMILAFILQLKKDGH